MASVQVCRFQRRVANLQRHHELASKRYATALAQYHKSNTNMMDLLRTMSETDKKLKKNKRTIKPRNNLPISQKHIRFNNSTNMKRYPGYIGRQEFNSYDMSRIIPDQYALPDSVPVHTSDSNVVSVESMATRKYDEPIFPPTYSDQLTSYDHGTGIDQPPQCNSWDSNAMQYPNSICNRDPQFAPNFHCDTVRFDEPTQLYNRQSLAFPSYPQEMEPKHTDRLDVYHAPVLQTSACWSYTAETRPTYAELGPCSSSDLRYPTRQFPEFSDHNLKHRIHNCSFEPHTGFSDTVPVGINPIIASTYPVGPSKTYGMHPKFSGYYHNSIDPFECGYLDSTYTAPQQQSMLQSEEFGYTSSVLSSLNT